MGIIDALAERTSIREILEEQKVKSVYFDNLFVLDQQGDKTEILKIEIDSLFCHVTIENEGEHETRKLTQFPHIYTTAIYLRLQKMEKDFKTFNHGT